MQQMTSQSLTHVQHLAPHSNHICTRLEIRKNIKNLSLFAQYLFYGKYYFYKDRWYYIDEKCDTLNSF